MSSIAILDAIKARIEAVCATVGQSIAVARTPPAVTPGADTSCFLLHLTPTDTTTTTGTISREHHVLIFLWVRAPDDAGEIIFLALADAISDAWFGYRKLGNIPGVQDATLSAPPGNYAANILVSATTYRQRVWLLTVKTVFHATFAP